MNIGNELVLLGTKLVSLLAFDFQRLRHRGLQLVSLLQILLVGFRLGVHLGSVHVTQLLHAIGILLLDLVPERHHVLKLGAKGDLQALLEILDFVVIICAQPRDLTVQVVSQSVDLFLVTIAFAGRLFSFLKCLEKLFCKSGSIVRSSAFTFLSPSLRASLMPSTLAFSRSSICFLSLSLSSDNRPIIILASRSASWKNSVKPRVLRF